MHIFHTLPTIWRRLNQQRLNTAMMITGLAVAFTFLTAISHYVRFETSFDDFWADSARTYRLQANYSYPGQAPETFATTPFPALGMLKQNFADDIEASSRLWPYNVHLRHQDNRIREVISFVEPGFFDLFDLPMLAGNHTAIFDQKSLILISETLAAQLFGAEPAMGQVISAKLYDETRDYHVAGVFTNLPRNSHLEIAALALYDPADSGGLETNWMAPKVHSYVKLKPGAAPAAIEARLPELERQSVPPRDTWDVAESLELRLHPLQRLHLYQDGIDDYKPASSIKTVAIYALSGILLVLIAGTNFVNTMIMQANFRVRDVAVRKIHGAGWRDIVMQFLPETLLVAFAAFLISAAGLELFGNRLFDLIGYQGDLVPGSMLGSTILTAACALALALFAGFYPALSLGHVAPYEAVHARTASLKLSMRFSRWMMSVQFIIAIAIVIIGSTVASQITYTQQKDLGYDARGVFALTGIPGDAAEGNALYARLTALPGISGATRSLVAPTYDGLAGAGFSTLEHNRPGEYVLPVQFIDHDYFSFYSTDILAGRAFSPEFAKDRYSRDGAAINVVLNESAARKVGFGDPSAATGKQLWWGSTEKPLYLDVVGVVEDMHHFSLKQAIGPMLYFFRDDGFRTFSLRLSPGQNTETLKAISEIWAEMVPDQAFSGEFLTDRLRANMNRIISWWISSLSRAP